MDHLNKVINLILLKYLQIALCLIQTNLVKQSACQQIIINCSDGKQPFHRLNRDLHSIYGTVRYPKEGGLFGQLNMQGDGINPFWET